MFMKNFLIALLILSSSFLMTACQSDNLFDRNLAIHESGILGKDAVKPFSHTPAGAVEVDGIIIDFSAGEDLTFQSSDRNFIIMRFGRPWLNTRWHTYADFGKIIDNLSASEVAAMQLDTIRNIGQLAYAYKGFKEKCPGFNFQYSSFFHQPTDGNTVYSTFEYLLAQACFQDDFSSQSRKAVLKMAVENSANKYRFDYQNAFSARRMGIFLKASILVKEKDPKFLQAVRNDADLQKALRMDDDARIDKEFTDYVSRYAINYLLNN